MAEEDGKDTSADTPIAKLKSPTKQVSKQAARKSNWGSIAPFAIFSFICFSFGALLLYMMVVKADTLVAFGLVGYIYYVILLPLGLAVSGFLFGVLRSSAYYRGKHFSGTLELGGPIVGFALVVLGGLILVPNPAAFPLTVFVHGGAGHHEVILKNIGHVMLDLGTDRRSALIGDKGQAYFSAIPTNFRGQKVPVWLEADEFETMYPDQMQKLVEGKSIYLAVRKKAGRIIGRVQDEKGNPISSAAIRTGSLSSKADASGCFILTIPGNQMQPEISLYVDAPGFKRWQGIVAPNANEATIILERSS